MEDEIKAMRRKKKVAGIDDPVVIIQRILNIFRQLHILDDTAKESFNKMILQQPPEIRHMCSVLPGGSLLQEYVDELEESQGIAPDQRVESLDDLISEEEGSKDTILANAMAADDTPKGQTTPAQKVSETTDPVRTPVNEDTQKQMLIMMQAMQNNMQHQAPAATNATIKTDPNFAKDIALAISSALATSDQERRKETQELTKSLTDSQMQMTEVLVKEIAKTTTTNVNNTPVATTDASGVRIIDNTQAITKAITESQLEMAKMFLQHNAISASASNSSSNNANNIQINTGTNASNSPELIGDIIKAQSQLFREMAKEQTKELSAIISVSLRETSQLNNKQLINALSAFQKENLKFFKEQAKNRPVVHYQAPINDENTVYEYVEQEFPEEEITVAPEEPSYIKKVLGNVFSRNYDRAENKSQAMMMAEDEPVEPIEPIIPVEVTKPFKDKIAETSENDILDEFSSETEFDGENDNDDYEINSDGLGLSTEDVPTKKKKKRKKKNKNKNISELENSNANANGYQPIFAQNTSQQESKEEKDEWDFDRSMTSSSKSGLDSSLFDLDNTETLTTPKQTPDNDKDDHKDFLPKLDMSIFGVQNNSEETDFISEISTAESNSSHNLHINLSKTSNLFADQQPLEDDDIIEASWEDQSQEDADLLIEDFSEELAEDFSKDLSEDFSEIKMENISDELDLKDTDFEELTFETTDQAEELIEPPHQGYVTSLRQGLNNQITIEESLAPSTAEIGQSQNIDPNLSYKSNLDLNAAAEAENDDSNSEWEWEYEEIADEGVTTQQPIEAQATNEEEGEGEWEWEYEEVSDEDGTTQQPIEAQAANEEEGEGEWEWEYEEVSDEDMTTEQPIEAQATNEEEGEWEWEYEEVSDEDMTTEQPIEAQAANEEEGEWEWEYEESSEEDASIKTSNVSTDKEISTIGAEVSHVNFDDADLTDDDLKSLKNELGDQEDIGFADLFGDTEQEEDVFSNSDPYAGGHIPANNEDLSLNSLQSGSLYFQEDVTKTKETQNKSSALFDDLESDLLLPEFSDDDHIDEPYKLNSDIKP